MTQKYEWKVEAVERPDDLASFAYRLEAKLNDLEKNGFEIQKLEIEGKGILLTGRKPARRAG